MLLKFSQAPPWLHLSHQLHVPLGVGHRSKVQVTHEFGDSPCSLELLGDSFWTYPAGTKHLRSRVQVTQLFFGGLPCSHEQIPLSNSVAISTPLLHDSVDREALGLLTVKIPH